MLLVVTAATGFVIFPIVYTVGQQRTSAMHGVMILAALPSSPGCMPHSSRGAARSRVWIAGCAVALAGEVDPDRGPRRLGGADATLVGDLLVLAAALVRLARLRRRRDAAAARPLEPRRPRLWGVAARRARGRPAALSALARDGLPHADATAWGAVAVPRRHDLDSRLIGWYWALDRGGIVRIATLQFLQPISGSSLAALVLGERLTVPMAVGSAVIVGVTIAQRT